MTARAADALVPVGLRLKPAVTRALERMATDAGQDMADYVATVLSEHAAPAMDDDLAVAQIRAEAEIKRAAASLAWRLSPPDAFDPDVTLAVFRAIRGDCRLAALYRAAIGSEDGFERNNPAKARVNRTLGGICKAVCGGSSKGPDGGVTMVQVAGEFCFTYTRLHPPAPGGRDLTAHSSFSRRRRRIGCGRLVRAGGDHTLTDRDVTAAVEAFPTTLRIAESLCAEFRSGVRVLGEDAVALIIRDAGTERSPVPF